jgi:hypothetical protein
MEETKVPETPTPNITINKVRIFDNSIDHMKSDETPKEYMKSDETPKEYMKVPHDEN